MSASGQAAKETAAGGAGVGPSRRKWDIEEYTQKARERDRQDKERAEENAERLRKGKKPLTRLREELPKATKAMEARSAPLNIDKNLGKTLMIDHSEGGGKKGAGFWCEVCQRNLKDSLAYLDHINGRLHLRRLGQTTQAARSSLTEVREKLLSLRESFASNPNQKTSAAQSYDFEARLKAIAEEQEEAKKKRKEEKKKKKEELKKKQKGITTTTTTTTNVNGNGNGKALTAEEQMAAMMGFGGFGTSKK